MKSPGVPGFLGSGPDSMEPKIDSGRPEAHCIDSTLNAHSRLQSRVGSRVDFGGRMYRLLEAGRQRLRGVPRKTKASCGSKLTHYRGFSFCLPIHNKLL
jgi:hypothetical protein